MSVRTSIGITFTKGNLTDAFNADVTATMNVAGYLAQAPTFGTAASAISTATISTLGYAFLRSLVTTTQTTCTITFGTLNGTALNGVVRLRPDEPAVLRLAPGNYGAQAAGEGYRMLVAILED
jgi:hypothetical protein